MLKLLQIQNIGIIDQLDIEFDEGLNVLTGETGAGKSIIIGALSLILGRRVKNQDLIKTGQDFGSVRGLIEISENHSAVHLLIQSGVPFSEGELLLSREITQSGKSKCFVNGAVVTLSLLKQLGDLLVDIHGTHDHQKLLNPLHHLFYLDRFGFKNQELDLLNQFYDEWKENKNELNRIQAMIQNQKDKKEYMEFQVQELKYLEQLTQNEDELERELEILSDSERLKMISQDALDKSLDGSYSLRSQLHGLLKDLNELSSVEPSFNDQIEELNSLSISIDDVSEKVQDFYDQLNPDPERFEELDQVLTQIRKHKLKYGYDFYELKKHYFDLKNQLNADEASGQIDELIQKVDELHKKLLKEAQKISAKRKLKAKELVKTLEIELKDLGMDKSKVFIDFEMKDISRNGLDSVELKIITNPGENKKPLQKIASGGELCRIMLAFKTVVSNVDDIPVLVFDEIDANIGGVTSVAAAKKMLKIAKNRQLITITHQPQIASKAHRHFSVHKNQTKNKTVTHVTQLNQDQRIDEIARMMGGSEITSYVREHAKEMIGK